MSVGPVLLIDGDATLRGILAEQIHGQEADAGGIERLHQAGDAATALALCAISPPAAVVLDGRDRPDGSAAALAGALRAAGVTGPIVVLADTREDGQAVLGAGASAMLVKPVRLGALLALLRRPGIPAIEAAVIGPYRFSPREKCLTRTDTGRAIRLTDKETAVLAALLRAGGKPVGRESLLDAVWGYQAGIDTHTLETHIYRLRRKIEPDPANARLLVTASGGYRLNA